MMFSLLSLEKPSFKFLRSGGRKGNVQAVEERKNGKNH